MSGCPKMSKFGPFFARFNGCDPPHGPTGRPACQPRAALGPGEPPGGASWPAELHKPCYRVFTLAKISQNQIPSVAAECQVQRPRPRRAGSD